MRMFLLYELELLFYLVLDQFKLIFPYYISGVLAGSAISALVRGNRVYAGMFGKKIHPILSLPLSALLGSASPICMYGTIPVLEALGRKGIPQHLIASFMVSSVLINPNLFIFSFALGARLALIRLAACVFAGILAGFLVLVCYKARGVFNFGGADGTIGCGSERSIPQKFLYDLNRTFVKTAPYFLIGLGLTALFDRYFPRDLFFHIFGSGSSLGVLFAASIGIPVYLCGGGTIPLIRDWLDAGMSTGAALAFMLTGPATKLNNLAAVKVILGARNFILYLLYILAFAIVAGLVINMI